MKTEPILTWIAQQKYYGCYKKDKKKSIEMARDWINTECQKNNWTRESVLRASKHSNCTNIGNFRELVNHFNKH